MLGLGIWQDEPRWSFSPLQDGDYAIGEDCVRPIIAVGMLVLRSCWLDLPTSVSHQCGSKNQQYLTRPLCAVLNITDSRVIANETHRNLSLHDDDYAIM